MTIPFAKPEKSRPLWQVLLAPMLLVSLGLHGLLLLLPAGSEEVVIPPPDIEQDSVAITRVPPAGESDAAVSSSGVMPAAPGASPGGNAGVSSIAPPAVGAAASVQRPSPAAIARTHQARTTARRLPSPPPSPAAPTSPPSTAAPRPAVSAPSPAVPTPPPVTNASLSQPLFEGDLGERLQTYVASLNLSQERIEQLLAAIGQRLVYSDLNTSDATYSQNLSQWQQAIRAETGLTTLTPEAAPRELSITYYQRACLSAEPGPAQVGVIVSPVGSPRREPVLLRSSGYGVVDAKALRTVADHQFPRGGAVKAYTVTVPTQVNHGASACLTADTVAQDASARGT